MSERLTRRQALKLMFFGAIGPTVLAACGAAPTPTRTSTLQSADATKIPVLPAPDYIPPGRYEKDSEPKMSSDMMIENSHVLLEPGIFSKDEEAMLKTVIREVYPFVSSYVGEAEGGPITISKIPQAAQDAFMAEQKRLGGDGAMIAGADWNGKTRTLRIARVDKLTLETVLPHDFTHALIGDGIKMPVPWGEGVATAISNLYNKRKGRTTEFSIYNYNQNNQPEMAPSSKGFTGPLAKQHYSLAGDAFTQLLTSDPRFILNLKNEVAGGVDGKDITEDTLVKLGDRVKVGFKSWYDQQHCLHTNDLPGENIAVLKTGPQTLNILHFNKTSNGEEKLINGNLTIKISLGREVRLIYFVKNKGIDEINIDLKGGEVVEITDPIRRSTWVMNL